VQTAKVQAGKEKAVATERVEEEVDWVWEREEKDMKNQLNELIEEINLIVDSFRVELQDLASSPDDDDEARQ
jgi:F0F1-type ATP synthase membrane subunit b/b'